MIFAVVDVHCLCDLMHGRTPGEMMAVALPNAPSITASSSMTTINPNAVVARNQTAIFCDLFVCLVVEL
jgi:hypothetical protein